jgi:hypothetical protein
MFLFPLFKRFKKGIFIALMLVVIEDVAWIAEPTLFGKVIDAVIDVQVEKYNTDTLSQSQLNNVLPEKNIQTVKDKKAVDTGGKIRLKNQQPDAVQDTNEEEDSISGTDKQSQKTDQTSGTPHESIENVSVIPSLLIWALVFVINSGVGSLRRVIDPRIFLNIYTKIATEVSIFSKNHKHSTSKTAARAELSQQYINFFQYRVPEIIENIISITGAILALYLFDYWISLTCFVIIIPLFFANKLYTNKVSVLQKEYHDKFEDLYDVFDKKDPQYVKNYFRNIAIPQRKIASWGAVNFGILRITLLGIFLVVLYIAIDLDDFSAGEIYSIVAYLWTFVTATEYMPELLESWTSLKDISKRLNQKYKLYSEKVLHLQEELPFR